MIASIAIILIKQSGSYDEGRLGSLARASVVAEVSHQKPPSIPIKSRVQPVFVTIEVNGVIRGCRGSLVTRTKSLEEEITRAARAAAGHDPRYRPLQAAELNSFKVTVTIVESKSPIHDVSSLTAADGLALECGTQWGIVLPWEGKDPKTRLDWAYKKAGVSRGSSVNLYRLTATRFRK